MSRIADRRSRLSAAAARDHPPSWQNTVAVIAKHAK
jgi:hypothetical protein